MANRLTDKVEIWSHGCRVPYAPDNTLEAFQGAIERGSDGIELDVQYTRDGVIVVTHDPTLERFSNGQGLISDYTFEELQAFDFSQNKPGFKNVRVPSLAQVFELIKPTNMVINVEIKAESYKIDQACVDLARQYGMTDRVIYSAADHYHLVKIHELEPTAMIAPLYRFHIMQAWRYCKECLDANAIHPTMPQIKRQPGFIQKCHELGIRVHAVVIDDPEEIKYLYQEGVDVIVTNYPVETRRIIEELEAAEK